MTLLGVCERQRIERALSRLGHQETDEPEDDIGGQPIPDDRLEALPTAARTTDEEAR